MRKRTWVVVSLLFGLTTLVPWLLLLCMNHGLFGVPPELADDSIYYYARVESVVAGHPFIGNPYFKEHTDEIASAFFGADWIASIPRLLHIPLFPSILLNLIVWSSVYVFLCLSLLSLSGLSRKHTLLGAVTLFISAFWLLERPVAMQIVFPVYILFLASFLWWLQEPQSGRRSLALVGSTVLSFYTYTYLWQIVTVCLLVSHALLLHDFKKWKRILAIDAVTGVLISPLVWYTHLQLSQPYYWETVTRIGYVATRTFGSAGLINLALIVLAVSAFAVSKKRSLNDPFTVFILITGFALVATTFSNVLTNKDLETAVHIGRFVELWSVFVVIVSMTSLSSKENKKQWILVGSVSVLIVSYSLYIFSMGFREVSHDTLIPQRYGPVLSWLSQNTPAQSTILTTDELGAYIPVITKDYVVFEPAGGLYLMSDRELEDRYLVSRVFTNLTLDRLKNDFRKYAGVGNAVHHFKIHNREVELCRLVSKSDCGIQYSDAVAERGTAYFEELYSRYKRIQKEPNQSLTRYNVDYVVIQGESVNKDMVLKKLIVEGDYTVYQVDKDTLNVRE